ncbi:unnamed protein product [Hydatigera taeniaeformis]|uniref:GHMP kinase C-terminal domain-containing protein n=1 Tax=Hydatigena taeniaeformis TaxID=6205 RepID=A0A3P7HEV7_HYDTA|nr:unnamed protein product [Hydatigera taeniaeformis]
MRSLIVDRYPEVHRCEFIVRAPGRINLIGACEHIDYSGYAVLPMALRQAVYIAVSSQPTSGRKQIKICSENETLETYEEEMERALNFANCGPPQPLKWYHYVLCGVCGFSEYAKHHFSPIMIEFTKPNLTITPVRIPKGGVFCVADSGARLNKAATPDYNTRVLQCKQAAKILLNHLGKNGGGNEEEVILRSAQRAYGKAQPGQMLGPDSPLARVFVGKLAECAAVRCATHCYAEAQRVLDFKGLCEEEGQGDRDNEDILRKLGELMNASHESCRDLYKCSCPELDRLVDICRWAGSYGSRLTGAGWGGCVISLVPESHSEEFLATVAKTYYNATPEAVSQELFLTQPGRAAGIIDVSPK